MEAPRLKALKKLPTSVLLKMRSKMVSVENKVYFRGDLEVGKICRRVSHFECNGGRP